MSHRQTCLTNCTSGCPTGILISLLYLFLSQKAGEHIFSRGTAAGKRVQSNMGAKNHVVVLPDADRQERSKSQHHRRYSSTQDNTSTYDNTSPHTIPHPVELNMRVRKRALVW